MTYKGAIDEVKSLSQNSLMPAIFKPSLNKIAETLEMETIRPKGHWLFYGRLLKCSNCGSINDDMLDICPNCGAKMESEGIDENCN